MAVVAGASRERDESVSCSGPGPGGQMLKVPGALAKAWMLCGGEEAEAEARAGDWRPRALMCRSQRTGAGVNTGDQGAAWVWILKNCAVLAMMQTSGHNTDIKTEHIHHSNSVIYTLHTHTGT